MFNHSQVSSVPAIESENKKKEKKEKKKKLIGLVVQIYPWLWMAKTNYYFSLDLYDE